MSAATPDLAGMRRNVVRATVAQGALVVAVLAYILLFPQRDGLGAARVAWVAVLPLILGGVAVVQYRAVTRAHEAGRYSREYNRELTGRLMRGLGVAAGAWLVVLVVLIFL